MTSSKTAVNTLSKAVTNEKSIWSRIARDKYLYIMLFPFILWFLIFAYKPMYGFLIAFKDYSMFKGIEASPWVGFDNFIEFLNNPYFERTLKNTVMISLYSIIFAFPMPIILALMLNEVRQVKFKKIIQTVTYIPYFISLVVIAGMVANFLAPEHGLLNLILSGLGKDKIFFLSRPEYFRSIFTIMNIWKYTGFDAIIYIAALAGVSAELYEACRIDGGGKLRQLWHITLPGIMPTIIIMLILKVGTILDVNYESIILLYQPATYETADVISTYVYRLGILGDQQALATAVGLFNSVIALVLVMIANVISRKVSEISLW